MKKITKITDIIFKTYRDILLHGKSGYHTCSSYILYRKKFIVLSRCFRDQEYLNEWFQGSSRRTEGREWG